MKLGIISIPKSGTYLASKWLEHVGMQPSFHLSERGYHDYRGVPVWAGIKHPERVYHAMGISESINLIPENHHWVGHLSCTPFIRRLLADWRCVLLHRRMEEVMASYWRWECKRYKDQSFDEFVGERMQREVRKASEIALWLGHPGIAPISFAALRGVNQEAEENAIKILTSIVRQPSEFVRRALERARQSETLTRETQPLNWQDVWSEGAAKAFMEAGGHVLNRKLGYSPKFSELFAQSEKAVRRLHNCHNGATVFCLGCGPSLRRDDLSLIAGRPIIAVNAAHRMAPPTPFLYHVVSDYVRMQELRSELIGTGYPVLAAPNLCRGASELYEPPIIALRVQITGAYPRWQFSTSTGFSDDVSHHVVTGINVIFSAIQLAAYLGAKTIALCGVDMDYSKQEYFDDRIRRHWRPPQGDYEANLPMFKLCREHLQRRGIELVNASTGGRVNCIRRRSLASVIED